MAISVKLLDILVCPQCKGAIELKDDNFWLLCHVCRLKYPIREDIPVMLVDEAVEIGD